MTQQQEQLLPPNTYGPVPGAEIKPSFLNYSNFSASLDVLEGLREHLDITPYRLGVLLGMKTPQNAYQWYQGRKRPSQANCVRLLKLVSMAAYEGLRLPFVESINWSTGVIEYKGGVKDHGPKVPATIPRESQGEGPYSVPLADFLDK